MGIERDVGELEDASNDLERKFDYFKDRIEACVKQSNSYGSFRECVNFETDLDQYSEKELKRAFKEGAKRK